jgi:aspartokinase-like uncharacterized kinase
MQGNSRKTCANAATLHATASILETMEIHKDIHILDAGWEWRKMMRTMDQNNKLKPDAVLWLIGAYEPIMKNA